MYFADKVFFCHCLSGCEEVENRTSQLFQPRNFPQPRNTTFLHEFYLPTHPHSAYPHVSHTDL